jgi:3-hydroxyisobutyrate dehydrogenase
MTVVGFIGLGTMGYPMASHIAAAGYSMVVYDARAQVTERFAGEHGASPAGTAAEVAARANVVLTSLPGPPEVEAVAEEILAALRPGSVWADLSTSRPSLIRALEPRFRANGAHVLDAPVSGGRTGAETRNLAVMVGGEREVFERIRPVLDAFGDKVFYAGTIGAGSVAKLVHNMIGHGVRQAIAEGLVLGVKAGVEAEPLWECVRRGAVGRMETLHGAMPRTWFRNAYEPAGFQLALANKDIRLALELAQEFEVPVPVAELAAGIAAEAMARGWGALDHTITVRLQEEAARIEVRAPGIDPARAAAFIETHP